jgi:uncharacterized protein
MFSYLLPYKICDPIHGFIRYNEIEKKVIDSPFFQRLRYIRQMGVAYLVYPGATHTRFEHSLGVMNFATSIYETLMAKHNLIFSQMIPTHPEEKAYWGHILRIAALCHDMGHLPFSHTAEKDLLPCGGHERVTLQIIQNETMRSIWKMIPSNGRSAEVDILKLSVSEEELHEFDPTLSLDPWEKVLSQIITDDNFGADRMDYLIRDAQFTGVGYGHFDYHQLIDTLRILPSLHPSDKSNLLTIGVSISGIQSVESLWIARYLMASRVIHHPKSRIYTHHMRRFITNHYYKKGFPRNLQGYLHETDATILQALYIAAEEKNYDALSLLKTERGFVDIFIDPSYEKSIISRLSEIGRKFGDDIFIDYFPKSKESEHLRQFPVLSEDGKVVTSSEITSFLRDIPIGSKVLALFIHPSRLEELKEELKSIDLINV